MEGVEDTAAAVSSEAPGGAVAEVVDTSASVSDNGTAAASTEMPTYPSAADFAWDGWDGQSDGLPEQLRGWGDKFAGHYEQHYAAEQAETQRLKTIYESLMEGQEDPRNKDLTDKLATLQTDFDGLKESSLASDNEYKLYKQSVEQALDDEAREYAVWYEKQYPHIFNNKEAVHRFKELLEAGWELDYAPVVMELNNEALAVAQKALSEGVPMHYAIELAKKSVPQSARQAPRPGAKITSGATGSPVPPNQAPKDALHEAKTLDDLRLMAAQRAYSAGRRR